VSLIHIVKQHNLAQFAWARRPAADVLPDIEPGVSPVGMAVRQATVLENSSAGLGGRMPPSTAGKMPAATWWRCPNAPPLKFAGAFRLSGLGNWAIMSLHF
jgi:hypothetical protein